MRLLFYANLYTAKAESSVEGGAFIWPEFTAGDKIRLACRFLALEGSARYEKFLGVRSARCSLGFLDRRPTAGKWSLMIGPGPASASNTTALLDHNAAASTVQSAINALPDVVSAYGSAWVALRDGSYHITFGTGAAQVALAAVTNTLSPSSSVRVHASDASGKWLHTVRLVQLPLAQASTAERILPQAPVVSTVQDGGADISGVFVWPEIQRLSVPPDFRGVYQLRYGLDRKTTALSTADGPDEIAAALNALWDEDDQIEISVTPDGVGDYLITWGGKGGAGVDWDQLGVTVVSAPEGDLTFELDLDTHEVHEALAAQEKIDVPLEIELEVVEDGEDPLDLDAPSRLITVIQQVVKLRREVAWPGLEAAAPIDWLRPRSIRSYVPFDPDQVITGSQHHVSVIGDGSATEFSIAHNLGTEAIHVTLRENSSGGAILPPTEYEVLINGENEITVTVTPAPAEGALAVLITSAGPASAFQNHTHTPGQIVAGGGYPSLTDFMDDIGARVAELEGILPGIGPSAARADSTQGLEVVIPEFGEILWERTGAVTFGEQGIAATALPARAPFMLPAVHDSTPTDPLPDPLPSPAAGSVWIADGRTLIPGGGMVRSSYAADNQPVASDGRILYPATRSGTTNSYYPTAFERTLFALTINDKMLAVNRTFEVLFGIQVQLLRASCKAQWVLSCQLGAFSAETTPATVGLNLEFVTWADAVFEVPIVLSRLLQSHFFGLRIQRNATGFLLDQNLYGVWSGNNAAAPATANFAIRARLDRFDTENRDDPRGWVAYRLIGSIETDDEGKQTIKPAKARIF